ncbi:MAG: hypothetical protein WBJ70_02795 [Bacilli bacterium]
MRKINFAGFALLFLFAALTLGASIYRVYHKSLVLVGGFLLPGVLLLFSLVKIKIPSAKEEGYLGDFLAVFVAAILTYVISRYLKISAFLVSPFIGIVGALLYRRRQLPLFCGSFAGMTNPEILDILPFIAASLIVAGSYLLAKGVYNGYGGKLGTIAFSGCFLVSLAGASFLTATQSYMSRQILLIIACGVLAATISYIINNMLKLGPVIASSVVGLAGAILLFAKNPEIAMFTPVIYGASFVGMTSKKVITNITLIALAGAAFGFVYCFNPLCGVGGKLGATAFTSVLCAYGLKNLIMFFRPGMAGK